MIMKRYLLKLLNIIPALRIKLSPAYNRMYMRLKDVSFGEGFRIIGSVKVIGGV